MTAFWFGRGPDPVVTMGYSTSASFSAVDSLWCLNIPYLCYCHWCGLALPELRTLLMQLDVMCVYEISDPHLLSWPPNYWASCICGTAVITVVVSGCGIVQFWHGGPWIVFILVLFIVASRTSNIISLCTNIWSFITHPNDIEWNWIFIFGNYSLSMSKCMADWEWMSRNQRRISANILDTYLIGLIWLMWLSCSLYWQTFHILRHILPYSCRSASGVFPDECDENW